MEKNPWERPEGTLFVFNHCAGIRTLQLGGAPKPDFVWEQGHGHIGRNLDVFPDFELWIKGYRTSSSLRNLHRKFQSNPAWMGLFVEQELKKREKPDPYSSFWLSGHPWRESGLIRTVSGLYLITFPNDWEIIESNIELLYAVGPKYKIGVCLPDFDYFLATKKSRGFIDENGVKFTGLVWVLEGDKKRIIITVRQNFGQQRAAPIDVEIYPLENAPSQ